VGPPVEFIEDGPDDAESLVAPDRPPSRRRWLPVLGAVAALGLAAVVARTSGDDSVTSALPRPTSPGPVVVHLPAGPTPPDDPNGAKVIYLSGCNACARVLRVPVDVGRAVRGVVPGATLSGHVTDASGQPLDETRVCSIYAPTGQLWICGWTNPTGNYSLRLHTAGDYKVVFSPELSEFFPEAEPEADGFPTEFWNNQTTLAAANSIALSTG